MQRLFKFRGDDPALFAPRLPLAFDSRS